MTRLPPAPLLDDLAAVLPGDALITDPDVLASYQRDQAGLVDAGMPLAAVLPRTTAEVAAVVRAAAAHGVPIVARGAGSGLAGGANALDGCLVVSLLRMDRILDIDPANLTAVVQPGVYNADLSRAVAEHGLCYPPDPASWEISTIGGNLATNAGGLCCVKYGVTRDFVLGCEVVLADGDVLRAGRRTAKGVAGYDLVGLFVGSEGTLGIITEATLRLRPAPLEPATLAAFFAELEAAGEAVAAATAAGIVPSLLEVMDSTTIRAVDDHARMDLDRDAAALLLAQSDAGGEQGEREIAGLVRCCEEAGATLVVHTSDPAEGEQLMTARRLAYPALEQRGGVLLDDVAVPRSRIPELIRRVQRIGEHRGVLIGTFGHVGDGNMHPTIVFDRADADAEDAVRAAFDDIVVAALDLGGTVTGEHGVGALKRDQLAREIGPVGVRVHQAIKAALDPNRILNPGKVFDG